MQIIKAEQESSVQSSVGYINNVIEELIRYAACVFEPTDIVEVRRLPSGKSTWHRAGELVKAAESLVQDNQQNQHIYVGANPRQAEGGTRSEDVLCARCLFVDFDGIDFDKAKNIWQKVGLPRPTLVIASGHGVHAYWRLAEPIKDMVLWSVLQKRLIALLTSDAAIHDPARIMRLPGFINHKQPIAMCRIIEDDEARIYELKSMISTMFCKVTETDYMAQYLSARNNALQSSKPFNNNISVAKIAELTAAKWPGVIKGGRNSKAFQNAAYLLKNLRLTKELAWPILQQWNLKNKPPLHEYELRQALRNANIYGRHPVRSEFASSLS